MKKFNKFLLRILAVLLCLILISTCIVSSTMAKFVVIKQADATVSLQKFGTTITVSTPHSGISETVATKKGNSLTYTITDVEMNQGSSYKDLVRFTFNTTAPNVPVYVIIEVDIDYNPEDFKIPANTILKTDGETYMPEAYIMPLQFTFGYQDAQKNVTTPYFVSTKTTDSEIISEVENQIATGMKTIITSPSSSSVSVVDNTLKAKFGGTSKITFKFSGSSTARSNFDLGFVWPESHTDTTTGYDYDTIATYLANHAPDDATIDITYTVSIEQTT